MTVRLEDARGCWRLYDTPAGATKISLTAAAWKTLPFLLTAERDTDGHRIYRSQLPAIGPSCPFIPSLHLPEGWQPPVPAVAAENMHAV